MRRNIKIKILSITLALLMLFSPVAVSIAAAAPDEYAYFESFEEGITGWRKEGAGRADLNTDYASHGSNSIRIEDNNTQLGVGYRSPNFISNLEKGKYYDISIDVYNDAGNGTVYIEFWNGTIGNYNYRMDNVSSTATVTGKWTPLNFTVSIPESATGMTIFLYSGNANKGISYFDNIRIKAESNDDTQQVLDFEVKESAHPRLYFNASELAELVPLKSQTDKNTCGFIGQQTYNELMAEADKLLTQSSFQMTYYSSTKVTFAIPFAEQHFPNPPSGYSGTNYPYWQEMGNQMKDMMQTLALAYSLTGEAKYATRAIELMMSLCNWSTWTEHPMINRTSLETGYFTVAVSTVYDMCYDKLTPSQKTAAETALKEKGLNMLYADLSSFTDHNYYVNKATALAIGSCLVLDKDADAKKYLSRAYEYIDWYLKERVSSESQEGLSYTSYSIDLITSALDCIKRVTGNTTLMQSEYMETVFLWAAMAADTVNGYGPEISDVYNSTYFYTTACIMNREQGNALAGWYVSTRNFEVTPFTRIVYYCADMQRETPREYEKRTGANITNGIIPGVGWGVLRTGWGKSDMTLICVGNNSSQGHSHYDQNSFVFSLGSDWIFTDPGYQDYGGGVKSDYSLSYGHSTIYVDGKSQDYKGKGSLEMLIDAPGYSYILGSAAGAYTTLSEFERSFVMVNHSGAQYYVIADDLASNDSVNRKYSWVLNAEGISNIKLPSSSDSMETVYRNTTVNADALVISGKGGALKLSFDRVSPISYGKWTDPSGEGSHGSLLTVDGGEASASNSFCALIAPIDGVITAESQAKAASVTETFTNSAQNGIRATYGELSDIILISKAVGVDGSGLISDGRSASLFKIDAEDNFGGYAVTDAKSLKYGDKTLLEASEAVSAAIYFEQDACVVSGNIGASVKLYLPWGAQGYEADDEGYITLTLSSEKMTITPNPVEKEEDPSPEEPKPGEKSKVGLIIAIVAGSLVLVGGVTVAVVLVVKKKKIKKTSAYNKTIGDYNQQDNP